MSQPNVSEDLMDECGRIHKDEIELTRTIRYRELDTAGFDFFVAFKIRLPHYPKKVAFPMDLKLQVKTSDNLETIGVILPVSGEFLTANRLRLSRKMRWRIKKHFKIHPLVTCMLFVSQLRDGKTREGVIAEIWRELQVIRRQIATDYAKLLI